MNFAAKLGVYSHYGCPFRGGHRRRRAVRLRSWCDGRPLYSGLNNRRPSHATLLEVNGQLAILPVLVPVVVVLVPVMLPHRVIRLIAAALTLVLDEKLDAAPRRDSTVVALDDVLTSLAAVDGKKARLVELRFFGGMTAEEIAEFLPDSVHRVRHEMRLALAWLHREVAG